MDYQLWISANLGNFPFGTNVEVLLKNIKTLVAKTPYLICESDEITLTLELEQQFIEHKIIKPREHILMHTRWRRNCNKKAPPKAEQIYRMRITNYGVPLI